MIGYLRCCCSHPYLYLWIAMRVVMHLLTVLLACSRARAFKSTRSAAPFSCCCDLFSSNEKYERRYTKYNGEESSHGPLPRSRHNLTAPWSCGKFVRLFSDKGSYRCNKAISIRRGGRMIRGRLRSVHAVDSDITTRNRIFSRDTLSQTSSLFRQSGAIEVTESVFVRGRYLRCIGSEAFGCKSISRGARSRSMRTTLPRRRVASTSAIQCCPASPVKAIDLTWHSTLIDRKETMRSVSADQLISQEQCVQGRKQLQKLDKQQTIHGATATCPRYTALVSQDEEGVHIKIVWDGNIINFNRKADDLLGRVLERMQLSCAKASRQASHVSKKTKKEKQTQRPQQDKSLKFSLVKEDGQPISLDKPVLLALKEASRLIYYPTGDGTNSEELATTSADSASGELPQAATPTHETIQEGGTTSRRRAPLIYQILIDAPWITLLDCHQVPFAGCPLTLDIKATHANPTDFVVEWRRSRDNTLLSREFAYTPDQSETGEKLTAKVFHPAVPDVVSSIEVGPLHEPPRIDWHNKRMNLFTACRLRQSSKALLQQHRRQDQDHGESEKHRGRRDGIRVVSFNILAPAYVDTPVAKSCMFEKCSPEFLSVGYRKPLLGRELQELDGDVICLQECSEKIFSSFLRPVLNEYSGYLHLKTGNKRVKEGCAIFIRRTEFEPLHVRSVCLKDELMTNQRYSGLLDTLRTKWPQLEEEIFPNLGTIVQLAVVRHRHAGEATETEATCSSGIEDARAQFMGTTTEGLHLNFMGVSEDEKTAAPSQPSAGHSAQHILNRYVLEKQQQDAHLQRRMACLEDDERVFIIANTHLFFHPRASHVRILQVYVISYLLDELKRALEQRPRRKLQPHEIKQEKKHPVSIILCGDLNCDFKSGGHHLLRCWTIPKDHVDWQDGPNFFWNTIDAAEEGFDTLESTRSVDKESEIGDPAGNKANTDCKRSSSSDLGANADNENNGIDRVGCGYVKEGTNDMAAMVTPEPATLPVACCADEKAVAIKTEDRDLPRSVEGLLLDLPPSVHLIDCLKDIDIPFTNYVCGFNATLDHIFASDDLKVVRTLEGVPTSAVESFGCLPCQFYPSDHIAIAVDLECSASV